MSLWRQLTRGLRTIFRRHDADVDVADEVQHYVDQSTRAFIANGLSPIDARRAAHLHVGNATIAGEQVRAYGWENSIATTITDLRYAARRLRASPSFTIVSVLTLALGIGASTAIFSAVNPILFEALPYPNASRIAMISDIGGDGAPMQIAFGTFLELEQRTHSFDALAVMKPWRPTLTGEAEPERLEGQQVSTEFFRALGVTPRLGRDFDASDDRPNGPVVAILSDALWRRRLNADPLAIGKTIKLDGFDFLIIGVMPPTFENVLAPSGQLWAPLQYSTALVPDSREWGHHLQMVGRLRPGVTDEQASRDLDGIAHAPLAEFPRVPWASLKDGLLIHPLQAELTRSVRPTLLAVLGAVLLVLAIACVNVTNLLLARGAQRRGEFAVRVALGAGRGRLVRQLITESLLLAAIGGVLGVVVGELGVRALIALSPPGLPRVNAIAVDATAFAFTLSITTIVGLAVGAIPAMHASREDPHAGLQQSSRRTAGGHELTRKSLVVVEVAFALTLLVSAGLLLRSLETLMSTPVGFDADRVMTMQIQESGPRFNSNTTRNQFFARALDEVQRVPGVSAAAFTSLLPLSGGIDSYGVRFESDGDGKDTESAMRYAVTPQYFSVMRIPLRQGRLLDERDGFGAPHVAVISESFAARKFPRRDAIGQRFHFGTDEGWWYTVVGVVGNVKQTSLAVGDNDGIYITPTQWHWVDNVMSLVVRTRTDLAAIAPTLRSAVWSIDKDQPIVRIAPMEELVARSEANRRFALTLFEAFGVVALILAATGIYGVLSGSVTERIRELGVRSALGASPYDILSLVIRQGMALTAFGIVIGLAGAIASTRAIASMLFGVSRIDPLTYGGVIGVLLVVSAVACWLPASRAARVDPSSTLRAD